MDDDRVDLAFPFTERDTPAARARIERDVRHIVQATRAADPKLRALVLTGGFSRGEGTVRDGAPVNDYDFVAVRDVPGGGARYRRVGHALTQQVGIEVDLLPVWRARLPHLAPKLFWHDAKLGARVVWGDAGVLARMPTFDARRLGRREAARLLGNRAAGLLLALPGPGEPIDAHQRDLQATKAVLAAMDATLLARGQYAPRMRERLARSRDHPLHQTFAEAVEWKLGGAHDKKSDEWWNRAAAALLAAVAEVDARRASGTLLESCYHALTARRLAASPSRAVRLAAWELVAMSRFPDGPADPREAARALARVTHAEPAPWPELKRRFFEARAKTLQ